jgi:hypothetical protein
MSACTDFADLARSVLPHLAELPGMGEAVVAVYPDQIVNIPWSVCLSIKKAEEGDILGFHPWELAERLVRSRTLSWIVSESPGWCTLHWFPSDPPRRENWSFGVGGASVRYPDQTN